MGEPRKTASWPIVAAAIASVTLVALAGYVGVYFAMAETTNLTHFSYRIYEREWQAHIFRPAAAIETSITGHEMLVSSKEELGIFP